MRISDPIMPRDISARVPLNAIQTRSLDHFRKQGCLSLRSCVSAIRIRGVLDAKLLEKSVEAVVCRHESLRTSFVDIDGLPYQLVNEAQPFELATTYVPGAANHNEPEALRLITEFCSEKVNLAAGPLFSGRLFKLSESDHILVCALDHMICDGTSLGILDTEIWTAYRQLSRGEPVNLPPLSIQFGDYCVWQHENYVSWRERHLGYWRERLQGAREIRLPRSCALGNSSESAASELTYFRLGKGLSARLHAQAEKARVPVAWLLLAVHAVALSRWCKQSDVVLLFVTHARYRSELLPIIGFIASHVYLRLNVAGEVTFSSLVREIKRQMFLAVEHEDFDRVTDFLPGWGVSYTEGYFNWLPHFGAQRAFDFGQTGEENFSLQPFSFRVPITSSAFPFLPLYSDTTEGITLIIDFNRGAFPRSFVDKFAADIRRLAEVASKSPLAPIAEILCIGPATINATDVAESGQQSMG